MADEEKTEPHAGIGGDGDTQPKSPMEQWSEGAARKRYRIDSHTAATVPPDWLALYAYKRGEVEEVRTPGVLTWAEAIKDVAKDVGAQEDLVEDIARDRDGDEAADEIAEAFENRPGGEESIAPDHDEHEAY